MRQAVRPPRARVACSIALACVAMSIAPAVAAPKAKMAATPSPLIADILACSGKPDAERLACYDKAVATLAASQKKGDVVVVEREEIRRTRRSLFGFNLTNQPLFRGDDTPEAAIQLDGKIKTVRSNGYDKFYITLDEGGVWLTTEPARFDPKVGMAIKIKHGPLGGFLIDGGRLAGVHVIRVG